MSWARIICARKTHRAGGASLRWGASSAFWGRLSHPLGRITGVELAKRIGRDIWKGEVRCWDLIVHSRWRPVTFVFAATAWVFILVR